MALRIIIIIALGGSVVTADVPLLLLQLTSATDVTTTTMGGQGGGQEGAATTDNITTINNISNAVLVGPLFSFGEGEGTEVNVKPINETYSVISYSGLSNHATNQYRYCHKCNNTYHSKNNSSS
jgi:hypothetical protein